MVYVWFFDVLYTPLRLFLRSGHLLLNYSGAWFLNFERFFSKKDILEEKMKGDFFARLLFWMFVNLLVPLAFKWVALNTCTF
jgi:hypothetical protein